MRIQLLLCVQLALAGLLSWTCFCRAVKTDADTHREIRWAIVFEGVAGGLVFGAPLMPVVMPPGGNHWSPGWPPLHTPLEVWLVLLFAVTLVQVVTARYWKDGVAPAAFQRSASPRTGMAFAAMLLLVGLVSLAPSAHAAPVVTPIFHMQAGQAVQCSAREGCVIFTKQALREEMARAVDHACGPAPAPTYKAPRT